MSPAERDFPVKVLAVDFDGVIKKQMPWNGCETINGSPVELDRMVRELSEIREAGWKVVIWSARCSVEMIKSWLESYDCDHLFDAINHNPWAPENLQSSRKINANIYLDDRGISFGGTWSGLSHLVLNFKCWWER
jgi:hypothetical protein